MYLRSPLAPLEFGGRTLSFTQPIVMGILNITPDSFSDGGNLRSTKDVLRQAEAMVESGAQILDIGGESSRPGAEPVPLDTELGRVLPVFEALERESFPVILSVDTYKAAVAKAALQRGAAIINDISACTDPKMAETAAKSGAGLILMHMRGTPKTMQKGDLQYDAVKAVACGLSSSAQRAMDAGVHRERIFLDPGIGFGKSTEQNIALTRRLGELGNLGFPIVYGPSRKRFLGEITDRDILDRDRATAAVCALAVEWGAHIFRVHNPAAVLDALTLAARFRQSD